MQLVHSKLCKVFNRRHAKCVTRRNWLLTPSFTIVTHFWRHSPLKITQCNTNFWLAVRPLHACNALHTLCTFYKWPRNVYVARRSDTKWYSGIAYQFLPTAVRSNSWLSSKAVVSDSQITVLTTASCSWIWVCVLNITISTCSFHKLSQIMSCLIIS